MNDHFVIDVLFGLWTTGVGFVASNGLVSGSLVGFGLLVDLEFLLFFLFFRHRGLSEHLESSRVLVSWSGRFV